MTKKLFLFNFLLFSLCFSLNAQTATPSKETQKTDAAEIRRQSFEKVWTTVNEKHYDPTFGGVDWQKVREVYELKALAAESDAQFHVVLNQMLGELKLSHFNVIPRTAKIEMVNSGGTIGIELKMVGGKAVVYRVEKDSTADKAALKPGFIIEKIDGKTVKELLAPVEKILTERKENDRTAQLYRERTLATFINGKPETVAKIEITDGGNKPQVFAVKRYIAQTEMSEAMGNFPPQEVVFESKLLDGNVGYIRFNMWVIPQMAKIREAIRSMKDADGIIFDLRGNPGGVGAMASGVAGLLVEQQTSLGSMKSRTTEQKFIVYPQAAPFTGKIVILIDYGSASTSEVFAAGMQEIGRAKIVGGTSAGGVLPSLFDTLPTGAFSDYKSPKNILIEDRGVIPDTEIKLTRQTLLDGRDVQIEEATKQIKDK
jgi:carboxyl-terminal processing protease